MPLVRISGSGRVLVDGFHAAVPVMMVRSMHAPVMVIPDLGSRGALISKVPAAMVMVAPSAPSRIAATSAAEVATASPAHRQAVIRTRGIVETDCCMGAPGRRWRAPQRRRRRPVTIEIRRFQNSHYQR